MVTGGDGGTSCLLHKVGLPGLQAPVGSDRFTDQPGRQHGGSSKPPVDANIMLLVRAVPLLNVESHTHCHTTPAGSGILSVSCVSVVNAISSMSANSPEISPPTVNLPPTPRISQPASRDAETEAPTVTVEDIVWDSVVPVM